MTARTLRGHAGSAGIAAKRSNIPIKKCSGVHRLSARRWFSLISTDIGRYRASQSPRSGTPRLHSESRCRNVFWCFVVVDAKDERRLGDQRSELASPASERRCPHPQRTLFAAPARAFGLRTVAAVKRCARASHHGPDAPNRVATSCAATSATRHCSERPSAIRRILACECPNRWRGQ